MLIESVVEIIVSIVMLVVAVLLGGWVAGIYLIGSLGSIWCYFLFKDDQC